MKPITFYKLKKTFVFILVTLGSVSILAQSEKNALTKINELKSKPNFNPQSLIYIDLLIDLAQAGLQPDSTLIVLDEVYDLSVKATYRIGESSALSLYGSYFSKKGETEKAFDYHNKALAVANRHNLNNEKVAILNNIGQLYWLQGNDANALTQYLEALMVAEKMNDTSKVAILNINIAELYLTNGDYETALTFYEIVKQLKSTNTDSEILGLAFLYIAGIYAEQEKLDDAEKTIDKSIEIFNKPINTASILSAYGNIEAYDEKGNILFKKLKYKEALKWYSESEKRCDELNYDVGYTKVYNSLANCYLRLNEIKTAEKYALKGLQKSKELTALTAIKESNLILSKIYFEKGQISKAYQYQSEYITLYEKGSAEKFKKGLGVLRSKMEFENQKKALIEENNKALAKQKTYVYITLATLLIVSLFLLLIFRTHRLQKRFTAKLKDSNQTKDKLFSVIAHDLRGPINSFYSLMKLYMDKEFSKEESAYLFPKAMADIQNISDMLNNLLLWAKTQMQGSTIKQQNIDINALVKDNIELLNPLAEKKSIKITTTIPENTLSYSDRDHMDIVLRNLISNAIKFTNRNGEIHINSFEKDDELQIEVSDNGVGMDLETQSKLFEKNNTESTYGTNNEKGTGLGLSLCRDMVESNGGQIGVSSIKDKGTTIYFTLPIKQGYLKAI